ncbi:hypothetical protein TWF481_007878 [Arthrobotrys musiformis]|uniref:Rhodanese domain-containing protein n=1 Tax=Arthrobotrys musiformis TaxID=47236 RepID=A0AAV9W6K1_9PEZI
MPPLHTLPRLLPPSLLKSLLPKNPSYLSSTPQIIPINATWFLPNDPKKRTGLASHNQLRIPHSRFFDIDGVKDLTSDLPHMLPAASTFVEAMRRLKIRREDYLVFYDSFEDGILAAPRAAWTARVMGHQGVSVLNNFKIYVEEGYDVTKGPEGAEDYQNRQLSPEEEYPSATADLERVISFEDVTALARENLTAPPNIQILDARPNPRFTGAAPEPRPGLPSGHIPGSLSIPFISLLSPTAKAFLPPSELRKILTDAGVTDDGKTKITSCGTGVTATVIDLALEEAGFKENEKRRVYDGSWTEWAQRADKELILKG